MALRAMAFTVDIERSVKKNASRAERGPMSRPRRRTQGSAVGRLGRDRDLRRTAAVIRAHKRLSALSGHISNLVYTRRQLGVDLGLRRSDFYPKK